MKGNIGWCGHESICDNKTDPRPARFETDLIRRPLDENKKENWPRFSLFRVKRNILQSKKKKIEDEGRF